ncbi:MAG TPA: radical SAM protein, partial [Microlunatus sp.]
MGSVLLGLPTVRGVSTAGTAEAAAPMTDSSGRRVLADRHGRVATDLRVSLTDRCNLRCTYCMPAEGLEWMPREELLSDDELIRLIRIGTSMLGIRTVRLTGGEPLLRKNLEGLVARIAELPDRPKIALTTNAIGLARRARALADSG